MPGKSLTTSVVVYEFDQQQLARTLQSFDQAVNQCIEQGLIAHCEVVIVDNGSNNIDPERLSRYATDSVTNATNVGFGAAHNQALEGAESDYFLVLNPDVEFDPGSLGTLLQVLASSDSIGLTCPRGNDSDGSNAYLAKRFPAVIDLMVRGFAPQFIRKQFASRLARYEYHDIQTLSPIDVELVSGCCMLAKTQVLKKAGRFDAGFFLYFEDFDLCLSVRDIARIVYVPAATITHHGGNSAKKGFHHIKLFARSAMRFYRKHGWKLI